MTLNNLLVEETQIVMAIVPVDSQSGANNGDWVSLKGWDRCTIVIIKAAGTGSDNPVITPKQAVDVSGTSSKTLNVTRVDSKVGVQTGIGQFTVNTQAAASTYADAASGAAQAIMVLEYAASDLDVANNFDCLQLTIPDTGSAGAQLISAIYILRGARYATNPTPSAIVD